jgi:hypothetical protein
MFINAADSALINWNLLPAPHITLACLFIAVAPLSLKSDLFRHGVPSRAEPRPHSPPRLRPPPAVAAHGELRFAGAARRRRSEVRRRHARGPRDRPRRRDALLRVILPGNMAQQPRRRGQPRPRAERGPRRRRGVRGRRPAGLRGAPQRRARGALRFIVDGGYKHAADIARCGAGRGHGHGVPQRVHEVDVRRLVGRAGRRLEIPVRRRRPWVGLDLDPAFRLSVVINPNGLQFFLFCLRAVLAF